MARSAAQMLLKACDNLDQSQESATTPWSQETLQQAIVDEASAQRVAEAVKDVPPIPTMAEMRAPASRTTDGRRSGHDNPVARAAARTCR